MNLADIIILLIVGAMVGLAVRRLYKNRKEDKGCGCGCGCSGCTGSCKMPSSEEKKADKTGK